MERKRTKKPIGKKIDGIIHRQIVRQIGRQKEGQIYRKLDNQTKDRKMDLQIGREILRQIETVKKN